MADSRVINLTAADSSDTVNASSVFFVAVLPDETTVAVAGDELGKRVSQGVGVLTWTETDQEIRVDGVKQVLAVDSSLYDNGGWWSTDSPNILVVPDDTFKSVQFSFRSTIGLGAVGIRQIGVRYTAVTSNKYGNEYPFWDSSSIHALGFSFTDRRPSVTNQSQTYISDMTLPIGVESGDQFELWANFTGSTTPTMSNLMWGASPLRRY
jgi:hypothetical protein